ncbi:MAG TPA: MBL fold metallo-hydrolase [Actinomycetales bacterium]|nr:MBL fold metallo-hydrolase [Actinomycetales bacterium]
MSLPALGSTSGWSGGEATPSAVCVLAPNPGPMTLDGTNTWVLHRPGSPAALVVDPGPDDEGHLARVASLVAARGARVSQVLLTHGHLDHSEGAPAFARIAGCAVVRALDPAHRLGSEGLGEGDVVTAGDLELRVLATPGHTSDSLSFVVQAEAPGERGLLTGDTVLGRGTSVVAHPDGRLGPYLDSLRRLRSAVEVGGVDRVLPGHGPVLDGARSVLDGYLDHREQRLEQVREAVAGGAVDPRAVVEVVYADVDERLWPAAELSVRAQLEYLNPTPPS